MAAQRRALNGELLMKKDDMTTIVQEIARSTKKPEQMVAALYAEALIEYKQGARIVDYVPLLAARRVRENLKSLETISD
jgi:hypothetical protein